MNVFSASRRMTRDLRRVGQSLTTHRRARFAETRQHLLRIACCLGLVCAGTHASGQVSVYTQHGDSARTGANLAETFLTPANVSATTFGKLYTVPLDGQVYAQPLVVSNVQFPKRGLHNMVYVATVHNSIYALDADNLGAQFWKVSFGKPVIPGDVERKPSISRGSSIGILSTPVIDPSTNTMYFVSRNESGSGSSATYTQYLNALNIVTGAPKFGSPHLIQASYTTADGTLTFDPKIQNQRAALTLANGKVYVAWASNDDLGAYHGWVISFNPGSLAQQDVYVDTTSGTKGGIWQAGQGLAVDAAGNLYISSGNGSFGTSSKGVVQTGNSFIKLSPSLSLLDWFTPYNSTSLNASDADLGASGVLPIPGTNFIAGGGKQGVLYLVDTNQMSHYNASGDRIQQEFQAVYGTGSSHIHGSPVYFDSATNGPTVYLWGENDYLRAFQFSTSTHLFNTTPVAMSTMTAPMSNANGAMPGGFLYVSANGNANGIVWASTPYNANAFDATVEGVVHAFDATTLHELWSDKDNEQRDGIGNFAKTVEPVVANGKVFVPTFGALGSPDGSGQLVVYGLLTQIPDGDYALINANSELALEDPDGTTLPGGHLDQGTFTGAAGQWWHVTNLGGNVVSLSNNAGQYVIDGSGASQDTGATVNPYSPNGSPSQQWRVTQVGGGIYTLTNVDSGLMLDVVGASKSPGAALNQYPPNGDSDQGWRFDVH